MFEGLKSRGFTVELRTNHRAESQLIVDNASRQDFLMDVRRILAAGLAKQQSIQVQLCSIDSLTVSSSKSLTLILKTDFPDNSKTPQIYPGVYVLDKKNPAVCAGILLNFESSNSVFTSIQLPNAVCYFSDELCMHTSLNAF